MKTLASLILLLSVPVLAAGAAFEGDINASTGGGDNLLADSTAIADVWTRVGAALRTQLRPDLGLRWSGRWSHFRETTELDGDTQEWGADYQRGRMSDRFLYYAGLSWTRSEYPDETYRLSSRILALENLLQYYSRAETSLRMGMELSSRSFPSFELADQNRLGLSLGLNHSFADGSALDLEGGWDRIHFIQLSDNPQDWWHHGMGHETPSVSSEIVLQMLKLEARFSKSLGANTGLSLSSWSNNIVSGGDQVLALPELETLPPEVFFFGEQAFALGLKRFLPAHFIGRLSMQLWNRRYLDTAPVGEGQSQRVGRADRGGSFSTEIRKRFRGTSRFVIEPRLSFSWQNVRSTDEYFDQDSWSVSLSVDLGF